MGKEAYKQSKRRDSRKTKKIESRQTTFILNKSNILLSRFNQAEAERVVFLKEIYSDEESEQGEDRLQDQEEEGGEEDVMDREPRFIVKRKAFRRLPEFECINELFEALDSLAEKRKKTKRQKCTRRISYLSAEPSEQDENNEESGQVDIPDALTGIRLLKN